MSDDLISLEQCNGCLTIKINRPSKANSLTHQMLLALKGAFNMAAKDDDLRVVYITGAGDRVFSGGADLNEIKNGLDCPELWQSMSESLRAIPILTIALINGPCIGGGLSLALGCDIRLAVPDARFHYPVLKNKVVPGQYDVDSLTTLIGPGRTATLLLAGDTITAQQALQWGLVDRLVPADTLRDTAQSMANTAIASDREHLIKLKSMTKVSLL